MADTEDELALASAEIAIKAIDEYLPIDYPELTKLFPKALYARY